MIFACPMKFQTRVKSGHLKTLMNFSEKKIKEKKGELEFDYLMAIQNIWLHRKEVPNQAHSGIVFCDYISVKSEKITL